MSVVAGQKLNLILNELCIVYDLPLNIVPFTVTLTGIPAGPPGWQGVTGGIGPYPLPANYLRMAQDEVLFSFEGTPFKMINVDLSEIDFSGLLPLNTDYPTCWATDFSTVETAGAPSLYVWPPPTGAIVLDLRAYTLQSDISTPESGTGQTPQFPLQSYLLARLTGDLMEPDPRADRFYKKAEMMLQKYLMTVDDNEGRAMVMKLDQRMWTPKGSWDRLKPTKSLPW
jgi:hypothetical protein